MKDMKDMWVRFLGWEESLEKGMVTHSSILASDISGTEMPYGLQSWGHKELEHSHTLTYTHSLSIYIYYTEKNVNTWHTHTCLGICVCIYVYICVCIYIYVYLHISVCMNGCVYSEFNPKDFTHYDYDFVI